MKTPTHTAKAHTLDIFDTGAAALVFTLTGELAQDFTGHMDQEATRAAERTAAAQAQTDLFPAAGYGLPLF